MATMTKDDRKTLERITDDAAELERRRDDAIAEMYSRGVPAPEIASALGTSPSAVSRAVTRMRKEGRQIRRRNGAGSVRGGKWGDRRRILSDHEASVIRGLDASVPRARGRRDLSTPEARTMVDEIIRLMSEERLVLAAFCPALGVTRQAVNLMVLRRIAEASARTA